MSDVTSICFYLPQFHPNQFNDKHWGAGFTEWTNVAKGRPLFDGHSQPKLPGELGFYDLRFRPILAQQISLAQAYGIFGFCFYYYRFGNQRELDLPVRQLLSRSKPTLPFCLCWANESWTRAWDGRSSELIREQDYSQETFNGLVEDLTESMQDPRYIRINGRPLFLIYQVELVTKPVDEWLAKFRDQLKMRCGSDVMLAAVYSHGMTKDLAKLVDFVVQFPPHRIPRSGKRALMDVQALKPYMPSRGDYFEAYEAVSAASIAGAFAIDNLVPGVCPDWDNSPRRPHGAHVLVGSSPEKFTSWVAAAADAAVQKSNAGKIPHPFLFVNAWNEWGEGAALEPSWSNQRAYLEAFQKGLQQHHATARLSD